MLDHVQAYIRQTLVRMFGGKAPRVEKFLLIDRKYRKSPEQEEKALRAVLS